MTIACFRSLALSVMFAEMLCSSQATRSLSSRPYFWKTRFLIFTSFLVKHRLVCLHRDLMVVDLVRSYLTTCFSVSARVTLSRFLSMPSIPVHSAASTFRLTDMLTDSGVRVTERTSRLGCDRKR